MPGKYNISDVMISYSRKDSEFVKRLEQALLNSGREVWVDWQDIPPTADWWAEVKAGIEAAHTMVVVISPGFASSQICYNEVEHAVANNKRIVPLVYRAVNETDLTQRLHPALARHNWVFFREEDDFNLSFRDLTKALETDLSYTQMHTRLLVRAKEWDEKDRRDGYLLRGDDLKDAETWLATGLGKDPAPTALQAEYIQYSRRATTRLRQSMVAAMLTTMIVLALLSAFAVNRSIEAGAAADVAQAQAATANARATLVAQGDDSRATLNKEIVEQQETANYSSTQAADSVVTADAAATDAQDSQEQADKAATEAANIALTADAAATQVADIGATAATAGADAATNAAQLEATSAHAGTQAANAATQAVISQQTANANGTNAQNAAIQATQAAQTQIAAGQTADANATSFAQTAAALETGAARTANAIATQVAQNLTFAAETANAKATLAAQTANAIETGAVHTADALETKAARTAKAILTSAVGTADANATSFAQTVTRAAETANANATSAAATVNALATEAAFNATKVEDDRQTAIAARATLVAEQERALSLLLISDALIAIESNDESRALQLTLLAVARGDISQKIEPAVEKAFYSIMDNARLRRTFTGHSDFVTTVGFSPDGKYIVSGSWDNTLKLWDINDGTQPLRTFTGHGHFVISVGFSPDGKYIVSGSWDNTLKLWDINDGTQPLRTFTGHTKPVISVAFSPDGKYIGTGSEDSTVKLWDINNGTQPLRTFTGHGYFVNSVGFSPDSKYIVSGSWDNTLKLWDINDGTQPLRTFTGHSEPVISVAFNRDGTRIVSGSWDDTLKLWDINNGTQSLRTFIGHTADITSVGFSPDGKYIVSGSVDNTLKLWDTISGRLVHSFTGHSDAVNSVAFSPDGARIVSGGSDNTLKLWDTDSSNLYRTFTGHSESINSVAFSPDGKYIVSGSWDDKLKLWDINDGTQPLHTFTGHSADIASVAFSPDGKYIVSGSWDNTLKLWDVNTGALLRTFTGHSKPVISVAFSPDGKYIGSGSEDSTVKLWDINNGTQPLRTFTGHGYFVTSVGFSPDGKYIGSGSLDSTLKLWDINDGTQALRTFTGHTAGVTTMAFNRNGKYIVSGSYDNTMKLWDASTGDLLRSFNGHNTDVNGVAFTLAGTGVVSVAPDGVLRLWDANPTSPTYGQLLRTLADDASPMLGLAMSPDVTTIGTGSRNAKVQLWRPLSLQELVGSTGWLCQNRAVGQLSAEELAQYGLTKNYTCGTQTTVANDAVLALPEAPDTRNETDPQPIGEPGATLIVGAPSLTPSYTPSAEFPVTPSPVPNGLPLYVSMDDGAPGWRYSGGWTLGETGRYGDTGSGWQADTSADMALLEWTQPIDLSGVRTPRLRFQSLSNAGFSLAMVRIKTQTADWAMVSTVFPSAQWRETLVDLSAYGGQTIWIQFAWLPRVGADENWLVDEVYVEDAPPEVVIVSTETPTPVPQPTEDMIVPTETPTLVSQPTEGMMVPTETPTLVSQPTEVVIVPTETASPVPELTEIVAVTLTPSPTLTEVLMGITWEAPSVTPTYTEMPTLTQTPLPAVMPPVYASLDDDLIAPYWQVDGTWLLLDGARSGPVGYGWFVSGDGGLHTLYWQQPINLSLAQTPRLRFQSLLANAAGSVGAVQISTDDGLTWGNLATVSAAAWWTETSIDLSMYRGYTIRLRFAWVSQPLLISGTADYWMLDEVWVEEAPPILIPTMVEAPSLTPTLTPSEVDGLIRVPTVDATLPERGVIPLPTRESN